MKEGSYFYGQNIITFIIFQYLLTEIVLCFGYHCYRIVSFHRNLMFSYRWLYVTLFRYTSHILRIICSCSSCFILKTAVHTSILLTFNENSCGCRQILGVGEYPILVYIVKTISMFPSLGILLIRSACLRIRKEDQCFVCPHFYSCFSASVVVYSSLLSTLCGCTTIE